MAFYTSIHSDIDATETKTIAETEMGEPLALNIIRRLTFADEKNNSLFLNDYIVIAQNVCIRTDDRIIPSLQQEATRVSIFAPSPCMQYLFIADFLGPSGKFTSTLLIICLER